MDRRCKHAFRPGCEDLEGRKLLSFSGAYYIFNNYSDKVVDDTNASTSDWNHMQQFHLTGGSNQQWALIHLIDGNYLIVNQKSGKALDVNEGSMDDGTTIIQYHLNGSLSQEWALIQLPDGNYEILNANSGKALDNGASASDHAKLDQWSYLGAPNQEWRIEQA